MIMISKTAMGIAVGIAGIFVGYCFYFDKKRRSDPDFKKKLRERRMAKKQAPKPNSNSNFPDFKDHSAVQNFFMQEVHLGEQLLASGETDKGVNHLANAIAVCGQPIPLLQVLQKTLPEDIFQRIVQRLPIAGEHIMSHAGMAEEDVE